MATVSKKMSVSIRIRQSLLEDMREIWLSKYGGKGRSRWVDEAVKDYLSNQRYFYQNANFLDISDPYAYQFILEIQDEGALTRHDEDAGIKISEKVKTKEVVEDPIANEKFTFTDDTIRLLEGAERNISLLKARAKVQDLRGCIIRAAIEYGIVHGQAGSQNTIEL